MPRIMCEFSHTTQFVKKYSGPRKLSLYSPETIIQNANRQFSTFNVNYAIIAIIVVSLYESFQMQSSK